MPGEKKLYSFLSWFKQPASVLSLVAAVTSLLTWFWVYANKGEIRIIPPDRVGIALAGGDLSLIIPLIFTNTGAPRTNQLIRRVTVELDGITPIKQPPISLRLRWRLEVKYIKAKEDDFLHDRLDYVNRAVPFAVVGGTSTPKLFEFIQVDTGFPKRYVDGFRLTIKTFTESRTFSSATVYYDCRHHDLGADSSVTANYHYCEMNSE